MRKANSFTTMVFLLTINTVVISQNAPPVKLPNIIPAPHEAAAFVRYGEIPVDYSTGVPNIQVPLYTVTSRKLEIPLNLSYHASGIKVQDVATTVGLGWVINGGGLVTRTVLGQPDYKYNYPYNAQQFNAYIAGQPGMQSKYEAVEMARDYYDLYADRYYFQLPTGEGQVFRYDKVADQFKTSPYTSNKINFDVTSGTLNKITVVSNEGTQFIFGETSTNSSYFNCWAITKMISADKTDTIQWFYTGYTDCNDRSVGQTLDYGPWVNWESNVNGNCVSNYISNVYTPNTTITPATPVFNATPLLDSIVTATSIVKYIYVWDRQDKPGQLHAPRLSKVVILRKEGRQIIKEFLLTHSYFGSNTNNNLRLKLVSLQVKGSNAGLNEKFSFTYNTGELPAYLNVNNPINCEDYWGYYNGHFSTGFIPWQFLPSGAPTGVSAIRDPDHNYASACMLEAITYPTGGKTEFEFEPNYGVVYDYPGSVPSAGNAGGFRIKEIRSYTDQASLATIKTYTYGSNYAPTVNRYMFEYDQLYKFCHSNQPCSGYIEREEYRHVLVSNGILPLTYFNTSSCYYATVTEFNGTETDNTGKTLYNYNNPGADNWIEFYQPNFKHVYQWDRGNFSANLASKEIYANVGGVYTLKKSVENFYTEYKNNWFDNGLNIYQTAVVVLGAASTNELYNSISVVPFGWSDTKSLENIQMLTRTVETDFENTAISKERVYEYNTENLLLKSQSFNNSKALTVKTEYTHPGDYSGEPYTTMVTRNIISPVVEQSTSVNAVFQQSVKTNYGFWGTNSWSVSQTNKIVPQTVEAKVLTTPAQARLRYHSYNNEGNIITVSMENDVKKSYLWGYNNVYPIAEVINAEPKDVFHTSFEDSEGNSADNDAKTGKKSRTNGFAKSLSGLSNGDYRITYWAKSGQNWIFQSSVVSVTAGTYSINLTGQIDEIRFYPQSAQLTTYCYQPLVGMISQCDVNNRTTKYEHDEFGRLVLVRDQDGNIVKKICYNYAGQPEACSYDGTPNWQNTSTPLRCKTVTGVNTGEREQEQQDMNPNSATGGTTRWVVVDQNCSVCPKPAIWQATGNYRCVTSGGNNTGQQEREEINTEACSATPNQTRWVSNGTNTTACPTCNTSTCVGDNKRCVNNVCETGVKVYTFCEQVTHSQRRRTYHYEFSNGTWSSNFTELVSGVCDPE